MTETTIQINLNKIPESAGIIEYSTGKALLKQIDIPAMKEWVFNQIPISFVPENLTLEISGTMPNYIAVQLGIWLGPRGKVVYKSPTGFKLEMDVV